MVDEGPGNTLAEAGDFVLATYREIAERFQLGSPKAARTKVKRARWAHDPPNHPADPLRIRVPRGLWDQAGETSPPRLNDAATSQPREARGTKPRGLGPQQQDTRGINRLDAALNTLQEQLERERGRADKAEMRAEASEERVRELAAELDTARDRMAELREARAMAIAKAEAADSRVDDLMAEIRDLGKGRAEVQAKAELLQAEANRLRGEAERLREQARVPVIVAPRRRGWRFWRRRESDAR